MYGTRMEAERLRRKQQIRVSKEVMAADLASRPPPVALCVLPEDIWKKGTEKLPLTLTHDPNAVSLLTAGTVHPDEPEAGAGTGPAAHGPEPDGHHAGAGHQSP